MGSYLGSCRRARDQRSRLSIITRTPAAEWLEGEFRKAGYQPRRQTYRVGERNNPHHFH